jgi:hypothetical protein
LSMKKLSIVVAELLVILVGKFTILHNLYEAKSETNFCFLSTTSFLYCTFISPHKMIFDESVHIRIRMESRLFIKCWNFPVGEPVKIQIIVEKWCNFSAKISVSWSLQNSSKSTDFFSSWATQNFTTIKTSWSIND